MFKIKIIFAAVLATLTAPGLNAETLYARDFNRIFVRKKPSISSNIVMAIPYGSRISGCSRSGKPVALLGSKNFWYDCKSTGGFIFGGLLSKTKPIKSKKRMHLWTSLVGYHEGGEVNIFLARGKVRKKGYSRYTGPPQPPATRFNEYGTYRISSGRIIVTWRRKNIVRYRWLPQLNAYIDEKKYPRFLKIIRNSGEPRKKISWKNYPKFCKFFTVDGDGDWLDEELTYFCLKK